MKKIATVVAVMVLVSLSLCEKAIAADLPMFGSIEVSKRSGNKQHFSVDKTSGESQRHELLLKNLTTADGSSLDGTGGGNSDGNRWVGIKKAGAGLALQSIRLTNEIPGSTYSYSLRFAAEPKVSELQRIADALEKFHKVGRLKVDSIAKVDQSDPAKIALIITLQD